MSAVPSPKKKAEPQRPIRTFRLGAIAANVWKRQTSTGFEYLDFSLSRSWKLKSGEKEGYSTSFFHNNRNALVRVIEEATAFIVENSAPDKDTKQV